MKLNAALLALALATVTLTACAPNYSEGDRVGVINKMSKKGLIFKSWEGEMNLGGFRNSTSSDGKSQITANVFAFNVADSQVPYIKAAMDKGLPVRVTYHQYLIKPLSIDSDYVVVNVQQEAGN